MLMRMIIMLLRMSQRPQSGGNQEAITKQSRPFRPVQVVVSVHSICTAAQQTVQSTRGGGETLCRDGDRHTGGKRGVGLAADEASLTLLTGAQYPLRSKTG